MFKKILIANRGVLAFGQAKQSTRAADVSANCLARAACAGDLAAGGRHV
ncbi:MULTISPECIES: hypothetical protein [unclassified Acidovorax]|nr:MULTISPECIES: hypothetical protein [unclassified Acidovorax]MBP3982363.1 hypothetical protein [Acidovorax sp. JG5]MBU4424905.1 hypothetical protein [Gammaproteobacteria bacterium]